MITGIAGFAGSHLAEYLLSRGDIEVHGIDVPGHSTRNLVHILSQIALHPTDLGVYDRVYAVLDAVRPDYLFHLAAQASVSRSWQQPVETLTVNTSMQVNLLQAIIALGLSPRFLVVGSADEYGLVHVEDIPIDENTPLRPASPYAVSKIAQDYLGYQYHLSHGLPIVRVRPFNHIGPRQRMGFVVPDFAAQVAQIEAGLCEPLVRVGNLEARRDFTDVRDMVRAYYLALTEGVAGTVYNLGSAQAYEIREILDILLGMSTASVRVELDPERMRPSDVPILLCDYGRFKGDTGWEPEYDIEQSLCDVLNYWRQLVAEEQA